MGCNRPSIDTCYQLKIKLLLGNEYVLSQPEVYRERQTMLRRLLGNVELELEERDLKFYGTHLPDLGQPQSVSQ